MDISVGGGNHNARERIRKRSLRIVGTLITTYRVRAPNTITDLELSCRDQPRSHRLLHKSPLIDLSDTLLAPLPHIVLIFSQGRSHCDMLPYCMCRSSW